jgi:hypothetical protein
MKQLFGLLLLVGLIAVYWKWIVAVVVLVWVVNLVRRGYHTARAEAAEEWVRRGQLVARCDRQHAWVMAGDPRGTYGECTYSP